VITKIESDVASQPIACDNMLQHAIAGDASASAEFQSTPFPTAIDDNAPESPKGFTDLDYLDGPTIIAEV
jgi:hypothetical protein